MRWFAIWRRNFRVWLKLLWPSLISHFGEPMIYLLALGFGLGSFVGDFEGIPYITFLAAGIFCSSAMNTASFEATYSAYTRMNVQYIWEGMFCAPLSIGDIVLGELTWAGTKSLFSASAILLVATLLGFVHSWQAIWILPVIFLLGCCFAGIALIVTAFAYSYDFFLYYITLVLTPLMLLSGVFFPLSVLPEFMQSTMQFLPLTHAVAIVRPLVIGANISGLLCHLVVILIYTLVAYLIALWAIKRRLLV